jgi:hypothetical protein
MAGKLNSEIDTFALDSLCALVELADLYQVPTLAECPYQVLLRAVGHDLLFSIGWVCMLPRVLGVAATLNRWWDVAEAHFQTAIEAAVRLDALPELGRTYLDYARMLAARDGQGNHQRASALVNQAQTLLIRLNMQPFAQRAVELVQALSEGSRYAM